MRFTSSRPLEIFSANALNVYQTVKIQNLISCFLPLSRFRLISLKAVLSEHLKNKAYTDFRCPRQIDLNLVCIIGDTDLK